MKEWATIICTGIGTFIVAVPVAIKTALAYGCKEWRKDIDTAVEAHRADCSRIQEERKSSDSQRFDSLGENLKDMHGKMDKILGNTTAMMIQSEAHEIKISNIESTIKEIKDKNG